MARVIIIGAGLAGLSLALFLARRGHGVDLVERDSEPPPPEVDERVAHWPRRGVPQARQPHIFANLSVRIFDMELPDLKQALIDEGCYLSVQGPPDGGLQVLLARRLAYEGVVRRFVADEDRIRLRIGESVAGLTATSSRDGTPHVTGVRLSGGAAIAGDFVADCSGRWTEARAWLEAIGARPWRETVQETPLFYLTQWRRLKPGQVFPTDQIPVQASLPYGEARVFPADNGWFSITLCLSMEDPLKSAVRRADRFEAVTAAVPLMAPWIERSVPLTPPQPLARINNCYRSLIDEHGPVVSGFALVGDAQGHTNPTLGRGVSLAVSHAQRLAQTIELAVSDPAGFARDFAGWTAENIDVWFETQAALDEQYLKRMRCGIFGGEPGPPDPRLGWLAALQSLARTDPQLGSALGRLMNLLSRPAEVLAEPGVREKLDAFLRAPPAPPPPSAPDRARFEALVGGSA